MTDEVCLVKRGHLFLVKMRAEMGKVLRVWLLLHYGDFKPGVIDDERKINNHRHYESENKPSYV